MIDMFELESDWCRASVKLFELGVRTRGRSLSVQDNFGTYTFVTCFGADLL